MRKVETQLGLNLVKVCRQVLTLATRFRIWETKTKKHRGTALASLVATVYNPRRFSARRVKYNQLPRLHQHRA